MGKEQENNINIEDLIKDDETLEKAHHIYETFTQDEELRDIYEARAEWKRRYRSDVENAEEEGIKKGLEKGIKKGIEKERLEMAKRMKLANISIEQIKQLTSLSHLLFTLGNVMPYINQPYVGKNAFSHKEESHYSPCNR